ncbi:hypothetical protein [Arenicella xantha]|nr:hypothetical protein [Arenicella xantha]
MKLRMLYAKWLYGNEKLSIFDEHALNSCIDSLPDEYSEIVAIQKERLAIVQHHPEWKQVRFYSDNEILKTEGLTKRLPFLDERKLIRIEFLMSDGKKIGCNLHAWNGFICEANYSCSTKNYKSEKPIGIGKITNSWKAIK